MKKAFAWLEANGVAYDFIDYKKSTLVCVLLVPHGVILSLESQKLEHY